MLKHSNFLFPFLLSFGALFSGGCATVDRWMSENPPRRSFQARADWVTQGPAKTNLQFRKVNRFTPILFEHPKYGQVLIQANAIDGLTAMTTSHGNVVWRRPLLNGIEAGGVLSNNKLLVGASDGQFYSISAIDGEIQWSFPTRTETISEPSLEDNLVLFLSGANTLYALDVVTGKQVWLYTRQDTQPISVRGGSKPAVKAGTAYVGFADGAVVALNSKTGTLKWERQLNRNKRFRDVDADPLVDGEFLFVSAFDNAIYCLRSATGDVVWKSEKGAFGAPLMVGDTVYFASTVGEFQALDRSSGKKKWAFPVDDGIATSAKTYKGLLVFGESRGDLHFVDAATGKSVGHFSPGRGIMSTPVVDEKQDRIYFISGEANVYAVKVAWKNAAAISYLK
jgi:outer membrane protein assembly factor BamB